MYVLKATWILLEVSVSHLITLWIAIMSPIRRVTVSRCAEWPVVSGVALINAGASLDPHLHGRTVAWPRGGARLLQAWVGSIRSASLTVALAGATRGSDVTMCHEARARFHVTDTTFRSWCGDIKQIDRGTSRALNHQRRNKMHSWSRNSITL